MKIDGGIGFDPTGIAEAARQAEANGYDGVWTAETSHDPFLPIAIGAGATEKLEFGTGIAVAFAPSASRASASPPSDEFGQGYLPYSIADGWEHVVRDLAYWRADVIGETKGPTAADREFFHYDRTIREAVTLRDVGYWGHFVGDASQPLHVTVHYNGWNGAHTNYPNPSGFSNSHTVHARFETALVRAVASEDLVAHRMAAPSLSSDPILEQAGRYLATTERFVPAVYRIEAAGGIDAHSPEATSLVLDRLAAGASEMRDLIVEAWVASAGASVGYPAIPVRDIESGAVAPTRANVGLGD